MVLQAHAVNGKGERSQPSLQSVPAFCADNGVSRSLFYRLVKDGRGPRLTKISRRTLISAESAADWRARMERETVISGGEVRPTTREGAARSANEARR
jgi:predicted DNA-binding transcriptional regulator AlpA